MLLVGLDLLFQDLQLLILFLTEVEILTGFFTLAKGVPDNNVDSSAYMITSSLIFWLAIHCSALVSALSSQDYGIERCNQAFKREME